MEAKKPLMNKTFFFKFSIILVVLSLLGILHKPNIVWPQANTPGTCGDGFCDPNETHASCPSDCPEPLTFLSTEGKRIINEKGLFTDLRGFHFDCLFLLSKPLNDRIRADNDDPVQFNAELSKYYCTDEDIKRIRELGANVVKIGFRWWDIKEKQESINESALFYLEEIIDRFGRNGIYVIPCLTAGRQNDLVRIEDPGPGLWDTSPEGDAVREWIYDIWEAVARKFKDNPYVAGYDIISEPAPPNKEDLHDFYEQVIRRIRNEVKDERHILFLEALEAEINNFPPTNISWDGDYEYSNISFSFHYGKKFPWPYNYNEVFFPFQGDILGLDVMQDKPLFISGLYTDIWNGGEDEQEWIDYSMVTFKSNHIHFTFFCYKSVNPFNGHSGCTGWTDPADPNACIEMNNAYYRPNGETSTKIFKLADDLLNGNLRAGEVDQAYKEIFLTGNFDRLPELEPVLIDGIGGAICGNGVCDETENIGMCEEDCYIDNFEGDNFGLVSVGIGGGETKEADWRGAIGYPEGGQRFINSFKELGLELIRIHVLWNDLEPVEGQDYNDAWERLDRKIDNWKEQGAEILVTILSGSEWASGYKECREKIRRQLPFWPYCTYLPSALPEPEYMEDYRRFVKKLVERYKNRVKHWQIENEVDLPIKPFTYIDTNELCPEVPFIGSYWTGDQKDYLKLLEVAYKVITETDQDARVLPFGFYGAADGAEIRDLILTEYRDFYHILDFHTYLMAEDQVETVVSLARINSLGYNKPIWVTENGQINILYVHTDPEFKKSFNSPKELRFQAEEIVKRYVLGFSAGVKKMFLIMIPDGPDPSFWNDHMGITFDSAANHKKPGFYTTKLMIEKLKDFRSIEKIERGIFKFRFFDKPPVYVLWTDSEGTRFVDLSPHTCTDSLKITHIVTALDSNGDPVYPDTVIVPANEVPVNKTPVFAERLRDNLIVDDDYPNEEDNDGDGYFRHIQAAIETACEKDSIIVQPGIYHELININEKAVIVKSTFEVDIDAVETTIIDGGGYGSVVTFRNSRGRESILKGFTIRNGSSESGGGIYCESTSPGIRNCRIEYNSASMGGGIYCVSSSPTITNCIITNNNASAGGGIHCASNSSITLINSTITANSSSSNVWGGIHADGRSSPVITNCILWDNNPSEVRDDLDTITFSDIRMEEGFTYPGKGNMNLDPLFSDPASGDYHLRPVSPCIDAGTNLDAPSEDLECSARPQDGDKDYKKIFDIGAYEHPSYTPKTFYRDADGDGYGDSKTIKVGYELLDGYAENAYDCDDNNPDINPEASEISDRRDNNCDGEPGDGDYIQSVTYYVDDDNPETDDTDGDNHFRHIQAAVNDAIDGDEIIIQPGTYKERINFLGKAITVKGTGPNDISTVMLTIIDGEQEINNINNNEETEAVNVVTFDKGEDAKAILSGITVKNGETGIYCHGSSPTISKCVITGNNPGKEGGGIWCNGSSPFIINCRIMSNTAQDVNDPFPQSTGGGIYCSSSSAPIIKRCEITNNVFNHGAGVFCNESAPSIMDTTISQNTSCVGGGIACWESSPIITSCIIEENKAIVHGSKGGGIYCFKSFLEISGCTIRKNESIGCWDNKAGGLYLSQSSGRINDCSIQENFSSKGSGIYIDRSPIRIENCAINRNTSSYVGGGIYCINSSEDLTLVNCTVIGNSAHIAGAIGCHLSSPTITNSTIAGNKANEVGDGIYCNYSSPTITNCILWGNKSLLTDPPDEIIINEGSPVVSFSNVEVEQGSIYPGLNNINADPLFDMDLVDGHLLPGSQCIDAGTAENAPIADKDSVLRPQDGDNNGQALYDIGAFEYHEDPNLPTVYRDSDGDGYGDAEGHFYDKGVRPGYTANSNDCDDNDPNAYQGAPELCDDADNDCDDQVDEDLVRDCSTVCGHGTETCENGQWGDCTAPTPPCCNATRSAPDYAPGYPVTITIEVDPNAQTASYAVEDTPPAGWQVDPDSINENGTWEDVNKKVKWGPFEGSTSRTLKYNVTAPSDATGCYPISGTASFDGVNQTICGDVEICAGHLHPADMNGDWQLIINELTGYGAAWRKGEEWPVPPNPILIEYVTRAGYLWKKGENYHYIPEPSPPFCWDVVTTQPAARKREISEASNFNYSFDPNSYIPGQPINVSIEVTPGPSTWAYAVEDIPPAGWQVDPNSINEVGEWDLNNKKVKWGLFYDHTPRIFTYNITPPSDEFGSKDFHGVYSVDGINYNIDRVIPNALDDEDIEFNMNLSAGWNLISLPVQPPLDTDAELSRVFPGAVVMYRFERDCGYVRVQPDEQLQVGDGYWIRVYEDQNYVLNGYPIPSYNKTVNSDGWEMIGGCTSWAQAETDGCMIKVIYRYEMTSGYIQVPPDQMMEPGEGFWILLNEVADQCKLTVEPAGP